MSKALNNLSLFCTTLTEAQRAIIFAYTDQIEDELNDALLGITLLSDALGWCSGSDDFAPEGKAGEAWEKTVEPLLVTAELFLGKYRQ